MTYLPSESDRSESTSKDPQEEVSASARLCSVTERVFRFTVSTRTKTVKTDKHPFEIDPSSVTKNHDTLHRLNNKGLNQQKSILEVFQADEQPYDKCET